MKRLLLITFIVSLGFSRAYATDEQCLTTSREHIDLIQSTDNYFSGIKSHASTISSFEIIQVQKKLTQRFLSLKNLFKTYDDEQLNCPNKIVPVAIAIYDFAQVGKNILDSKALRRVVKGFVKFKEYQLRDYFSYYKKYTKDKLVTNVLKSVDRQADVNENYKKMISQVDNSPSILALSDIGVKGTTAVVAGAARLWGFISDHTAWRQGRLKNNSEVIDLLTTNLKPLDLIYEKRTFLLTNYTIPGHWGHVGIWLGTKSELIEMGIWDKEYFAPFRSFVEEGKNIIEVRKEGILYKSLEEFTNLDEVAITRVKNITDNAQSVFTELTLQLKKKYDFKFDARSADKITCAELVTFTYGDIKWAETKTLFQISISPDDMAKSTLDKDPASEFILYLKGNKDKKSFENLGFNDWAQLFNNKK